MPSFNVSPVVNINEFDGTTIVPAVSSTAAGFAGVFRWGPANKAILVDTVDTLKARFLPPTALNGETFMTAASFLSYGKSLYVSRAVDANTFNAIANTGTLASANVQITNLDTYIGATFNAAIAYIGRYPGLAGNSLRVSVCDSAAAYKTTLQASGTDANNTFTIVTNTGASLATLTVTNSANTPNTASADTEMVLILSKFAVGSQFKVGNSSIGYQYMQVTAKSSSVPVSGVSTATVTFAAKSALSANVTQSSVDSYWEFFNAVSAAPGTSSYAAARGGVGDELHVVVVDDKSLFSGTAGQILETYQGLSRASDAKSDQGGSIYYPNVINSGSKYIFWANDRTGALTGVAATITAASTTQPLNLSFIQGTDCPDEATISLAAIQNAYAVYASAESIDVSLIVAGKARQADGVAFINGLVSTISEARKDCIVAFSPPRETVVNNAGSEATSVIAFRNQLTSSSYAVMDSGYKYAYDKYNDVYRYIPLNGDIAGVIVRTDDVRDPWFSPGGYTRGQIKNVVKLAYNPGKPDRDLLYNASVNPVVSFPGQGTVLYGDKTLLAKPSAFDRINVRRLFIVVEKAVATAAKFSLFEFNDEFTQAQFRNMVEPYLRLIQGRRGIIDFRVVCDATNNTPQIVDSNTFVGDMYIKPARSINFINLNFVAARTGVDFSEIVGKF